MNPQDGDNNQPPLATPEGQFEDQFGSGSAKPPVAESDSAVADNSTAPGLIDTALANLGTTPPPASSEASQQPEQTPENKLKQRISDAIDVFLQEATKDKAA